MNSIAVFGVSPNLLRELNSRLRDVTLLQATDETIPACDILVDGRPDFCILHIESLSKTGKVVFHLVHELTHDQLNASGPKVILINPERYRPSHQLIRQQLDSGKLGEPGLLRLHRWEPAPLRLRDLDLVLWYFDSKPNVVHAKRNAWCSQIHLGFPNGGMALLEYSTRLPKGDTYYSVSLIGAQGAVYADDQANAQLLYQGGSARAIRSDDDLTQWTAMVQALAAAGVSGPDVITRNSNSPPTWFDVLAVNDAVEQSLRTKQSVAMQGA